MKKLSLALFLTLIIIGGVSLIPSGAVKAQTGDFLVSAQPAHASIGTDGTARFVVKVSSVNGFSGSVVLAVTGLSQTGVSRSYASFQPGTLTLASGGQAYSVLTLTISTQYVTLVSNTISTLNFNVAATGNGITHTIPLAADVFYGTQSTVQLADTALTLSPNTIQTTASITQSQTITVELTLTSGATTNLGQQVLSATVVGFDLPSGLLVTITPVTTNILAGQSVTVSINLLMTPQFLQAGGTYIFAFGINAIMQGPLLNAYSSYQNYFVSRAVPLTIIIPPAFTVTVNPTIFNVLVGGSSEDLGITITPTTSGLTDPIVLSVQGLPAGLITSFQANPLAPNGLQPVSTNLVVQAPSGTFPVTQATVTVSATSSGITNTATALLTLQPQGDYTITADQTLLSFTGAGQSKTVTLTITPENGFQSNINLTTLNMPVGFNVTFNPANIQIRQTTPITVLTTIVAGPNIQPGSYTPSLVSSTGGITPPKNLQLTILVRAGVGQIWPIVLVMVVLIAVISIIAFIGIPRGREVRRIPQQPEPGTPSLPP
jgi:hypothetical protein